VSWMTWRGISARPYRVVVAGLAHHGGQAQARLLLRDVPLGDVLLDEREEEAEGGRVVAEQRCVRNAPGVHRRERHARKPGPRQSFPFLLNFSTVETCEGYVTHARSGTKRLEKE